MNINELNQKNKLPPSNKRRSYQVRIIILEMRDIELNSNDKPFVFCAFSGGQPILTTT